MARKRREYSARERRELWERWRRGDSLSDIGRALRRDPATIHWTIRQRGGVLSKLTQPQFDAIALKLNTRPRETLGFKTPAATLEAALR